MTSLSTLAVDALQNPDAFATEKPAPPVPPSPNLGQKEAAEAFFQFLFSPDKEFIISGPAGTGKTFLMTYIIDVIIPRYHETCQLMGIPVEYEFVDMTATTNKAAEVLGSSLAHLNREVGTIHSYLNLKVDDDWESGKSKIIKTRNWMVHHKKVIFIDESSMIDTPLDNVLHEGTNQCKLVFVGDHCQLAPVLEKLSPVYTRNSPFFALTEPMRNSGQPALMALCQQLRDTVESGEFKPIQIVPGVIDWLDNTTMPQELARVFAQQTRDSRILAYSNARVLAYNDYIRSMRQLSPLPVEGEILVNNRAIQLGSGSFKTMLSVEQEVTIGKVHHQSKVEITREVDLEVIYADLITKNGGVINDVALPVDRAHYNALVKYFGAEGKKSRNFERYFYLRNNFPDLRQRDAATVHKSQGSTYDSVFVDLSNISTCTHADQTARLLYVALSRAKNRVFLYGDLAGKYGGLRF